MNCSHITDAGLHWMARGCPALKRLEIANLTRIGNPGPFLTSSTTGGPRNPPSKRCLAAAIEGGTNARVFGCA